MQNRREFLKTASALIAGGLLSNQFLTSCAPAEKKHIGLQMYSLRDDISELGVQKVLEAISKMGYVNLETAGYGDGTIYGMKPADFKKACEDLGMRATSAHLSRFMSDNEQEDLSWWAKAIETHKEAGMKYMVMPVSPLNENSTIDDIKRYGDYFYKIGLAAAGAGLKFGYHNHDYEFKHIAGEEKCIYDLMIENTSPDHVFFQMDVYWVMRGGQDPVAYMKKYPIRFPVLHIKDETVIGGSGKLDYNSIFTQAYANGMKDWYVEVERYDTTPQEDVKKSYDFLNNATFVK